MTCPRPGSAQRDDPPELARSTLNNETREASTEKEVSDMEITTSNGVRVVLEGELNQKLFDHAMAELYVKVNERKRKEAEKDAA